MRFAFFIHENVSRLDVSMQNAVFMPVMNGARQLGNEFHRLSDGHRRVFNHFVKLTAFDKLHSEVALSIALAYLVDWDDARMIEARRGLGFQTEALEMCLGRPLAEADDLQSNDTVETLLSCTKHDSLTAASDLFK